MTVLAQLLGLLDQHREALAKYRAAADHWEVQYDTQPESVASIARQRMDAEYREWESIGRKIEDFVMEFEDEVREELRAAVGKSNAPSE